MQNRSSIIKHFDFIALDLLSLTVSFLISYFIKTKDGIATFNRLYLAIYFWMLACGIAYIILLNPYKNILRRGLIAEIQCSVFFILFNLTLVALALYAFKQGYYYSRTQLVYTYLIYLLLSVLLRHLRKKYLIKDKRENKINILVIVDKENSGSVVYNIENSEFSEYEIKAIFITDDDNCTIKEYPVFNMKDDIFDVAVKKDVLEIFAYCQPGLINKETIIKTMEKGINFHLCIDRIFGFEPDNEELSNLAMYRTLNINTFSFSPKQIIYSYIKRAIDTVLSLFACLFLLPFYIVVKLSYLLTGDKEPVIYTQTRVGLNGREFKLYKFRSLVHNADEILKEYLKDDNIRKEWEENFKLDNDPRITKIGNILRKTSLDEFPQFVNVLIGDMSIIGPRPLVPGELKEKNGLKLYERVKPGITGWWACNGRSNISYQERMELEYYYVRNYSFSLDVMCVLKTIYVVLFQKGAK